LPKKAALQIQTRLKSAAGRRPLNLELSPERFDVPVKRETLLLLELEVQEPCVNLHSISQLALRDLGAALQILKLAGREYGESPGRPVRIEDCISDLGLDACLRAVFARPLVRDERYTAIAEVWEHSREIAQYARLVAEEMPDVNPEEAYLVGLLHGIGLVASVLGWENKTGAGEVSLAGFKLARQWSLPRSVIEFYSERHTGQRQTHWSAIVQTAHQLAFTSPVYCPFRQDLRPHLLRIV
jgi:HD-like signal output (HDOD) protein